MNRMKKPLILAGATAALLCADVAPHAPLGLGFVREAQALIGLPFTPLSMAGVARRTTRRVVYADTAVAATAAATSAAAASSAAAAQQAQKQQAQQQAQGAPPPPAGAPAIGTVVASLPPGCVATPIKGVQYYNCGPGVFYRTAFQGNNLVYVAAQP